MRKETKEYVLFQIMNALAYSLWVPRLLGIFFFWFDDLQNQATNLKLAQGKTFLNSFNVVVVFFACNQWHYLASVASDANDRQCDTNLRLWISSPHNFGFLHYTPEWKNTVFECGGRVQWTMGKQIALGHNSLLRTLLYWTAGTYRDPYPHHELHSTEIFIQRIIVRPPLPAQ